MVSTATDRECAQAVNQEWGNLPIFQTLITLKGMVRIRDET